MNRLLLALALLALCAGCRQAPEAAPEEAPPPAELVPAEAGEPAGAEAGLPAKGTTEEYVLDRAVTVDGGRELALRLHGRAAASGYGTWDYGIGSIDVLEGDTLLQTLSVREAIDAACADDGLDNFWEDDYTSSYEADAGLSVEDVSFDGAGDLQLQWFLGTVNSARLFWLWDPEAGRFRYAFTLSGYDFTVDPGAEQLVTEARCGYGQYDTNYYQYGADGALELVKQVRQDKNVFTTFALVDGVWAPLSVKEDDFLS